MTRKNQWVAIDGKRYNIASMMDIGLSDRNWGTGISLKHTYLMPRSRRVILHTYSIWENPRTHCCYGDSYSVADDMVIARLADKFGNDHLMNLLPEVTDA